MRPCAYYRSQVPFCIVPQSMHERNEPQVFLDLGFRAVGRGTVQEADGGRTEHMAGRRL